MLKEIRYTTGTEIISNNFSAVLSYNLLKNLEKWDGVEEEIEEEIEEGSEIDFAISDLKRLLKNKECVCGTPLEEHTNSYEHIEHLIKSLEERNKSKDIDSTSLNKIEDIG